MTTEDKRGEKSPEKDFKIEIDKVSYVVHEKKLTGEQIRHAPPTPIGPDRNLFEVVQGHPDRKIENHEVVEIRDGEQFVSAPVEFRIEIDKVSYEVHEKKLTGEQIRHVPPAPIGPDRNLFEVVPGHPNKKIGDSEVVDIRNGEQFVSAPVEFRIQIDRVHYVVHEKKMTGEQIRHVPPTPIGPDRDLFEVVPGHPDRKIENKEVVEIRDGERFFTAPAHINPGRP